jgi:predicted HTH domain antitoxin
MAMATVSLTIPDSALSALRRSPAELGRELKLAAAIHWYGRGLMSQERAAELAGMNRRDFVRALAREGVDVFILDDDSLAGELGQDSGEPSSRR